MLAVICCMAKSDDRWGLEMAGKSLLAASEEQRVALRSLAESRDRGEADRARGCAADAGRLDEVPGIAEAFGVREDTGSPVAQRLRARRRGGAEGQRSARSGPGEE